MWEIRIKQYFQIQDYALWEVIENGNSWVPIPITTTETGPSTGLKMTMPSTAEEKTAKKNDVKARSLLLMALPNEHQLTFNQYVDAQSMFAAQNEATKKTQKALLKQQYENFNASSSKSLDSIFNRLQKLVSRLAILGVVTPEDLNVKFLRSLPSEWDTHVVVWMNKPNFDTMGLDDLYNNFKIVEQKVKKSTTNNNDDKNLAFLTTFSPSSTNTINTVNTRVSTGNTKSDSWIEEEVKRRTWLLWEKDNSAVFGNWFSTTRRKECLMLSQWLLWKKKWLVDNDCGYGVTQIRVTWGALKVIAVEKGIDFEEVIFSVARLGGCFGIPTSGLFTMANSNQKIIIRSSEYSSSSIGWDVMTPTVSVGGDDSGSRGKQFIEWWLTRRGEEEEEGGGGGEGCLHFDLFARSSSSSGPPLNIRCMFVVCGQVDNEMNTIEVLRETNKFFGNFGLFPHLSVFYMFWQFFLN
ncbi:hypothetical protein Tco_0428573 [Tanacetum coccineum]